MRILSLGAGHQSTALWALADRNEIERFDYCIFADTGEEPDGETPSSSVYKHLSYLRAHSTIPIITCWKGGRLGDHLIHGIDGNGGRFASVPFFGLTDTQTYGKTRRQCSREYKLEVIHHVIRRDLLGLKPGQRVPKGTRIYQAIGFSYEEQGRIGRTIASWKYPWITPIFPLYERKWTRQHCVEYLRTVIPYEVPRSACVFCPFRRNESWRWLRDNDLEGWQRAIEIDRAIRMPGARCNQGLEMELYVHDSRQPLETVNLDAPELQLGFDFDGCTGGCAQ